MFVITGLKKQGFYKHKASSLEVDTTGRLAMSLSDFEVAAGRARVHGLEESKMHKAVSHFKMLCEL